MKRKILAALLAVALLIFPLLEMFYNLGVIAYSPGESLLKSLGFSADDDGAQYVEFLSVGQGDATLVTSFGKTVLIDFGLKDESDELYWQLKARKVDRIDLALITHGHKDHLGGFLGLAERMEIESLIISPEAAENSDSKEYKEVIAYARENNIKLLAPKVGDKYNFGKASLQILYVGDSKQKENNRSVISRVSLKGKKILFMGDTEGENEEDFLTQCNDVSADIIKLGHHGSYTATGYQLLQKTGVRIAIASSGYNNSYGHPSNKVLERLEKYNVTCYRTDLDGNIRCEVEDNGFTVFTEREYE